jgi:hypothetical protein
MQLYISYTYIVSTNYFPICPNPRLPKIAIQDIPLTKIGLQMTRRYVRKSPVIFSRKNYSP